MQYKNLIWLGSTKKDLKQFPKQVQRHVGYALFRAQQGRTHQDVKPMKGFKTRVWEIVTRYSGDAYRTAYYVQIDTMVYVLHVFQKKSKQGTETPKYEIETIKNRLKTIL